MWVIGDVHLTVFPRLLAVGIDDIGTVMVDARRALFEKRDDDDHAQFRGQSAEGCKGNRSQSFCKRKIFYLLALTEIVATI